ncbi:pathogenicity island protein [Staphylococcus xylosus]|uniref:pathogenicity island protein n=1 Tax=Staphylococcus xylosus TaxID=1288 RepID=UPI0022779FD1
MREVGRRLLEVQAISFETNYDKQAEKIGLIVGIPEEMYFCSISRVSVVYVEYIENQWVAWRESYVPNSNRRTSYKVISHGGFELVMARTKNYLGYIKKNK